MKKTSIGLEENVLDRIDSVVEKNVVFTDRSHFIRVAIDKELKLYEGAQ
jgi:metal-responsive CopG/Arc/MetJ family transcriptional regulator